MVGVGLGQGVEHGVLGGHRVGGGGAGGRVVPGEDHHGPAVMETGGHQEVVITAALHHVSCHCHRHLTMRASPEPSHHGRSLWLPTLQSVRLTRAQLGPVRKTPVEVLKFS